MQSDICVLVVDRSELSRISLQTTIGMQPGFTTIEGEADLESATLPPAQLRRDPDVILWSFEDKGDWAKDMQKIIETKPNTRILVIADDLPIPTNVQLITHGAMGIIHKQITFSQLIKVIGEIDDDYTHFSPETISSLVKHIQQPAKSAPPVPKQKKSHAWTEPTDEELALIATLTDREREVLEILCEGSNNKTIADRLFISIITVRHHISSILSKVHLSSRFELAMFAISRGLVKFRPTPKQNTKRESHKEHAPLKARHASSNA